jgi:hypothetical protein
MLFALRGTEIRVDTICEVSKNAYTWGDHGEPFPGVGISVCLIDFLSTRKCDKLVSCYVAVNKTYLDPKVEVLLHEVHLNK